MWNFNFLWTLRLTLNVISPNIWQFMHGTVNMKFTNRLLMCCYGRVPTMGTILLSLVGRFLYRYLCYSNYTIASDYKWARQITQVTYVRISNWNGYCTCTRQLSKYYTTALKISCSYYKPTRHVFNICKNHNQYSNYEITQVTCNKRRRRRTGRNIRRWTVR